MGRRMEWAAAKEDRFFFGGGGRSGRAARDWGGVRKDGKNAWGALSEKRWWAGEQGYGLPPPPTAVYYS